MADNEKKPGGFPGMQPPPGFEGMQPPAGFGGMQPPPGFEGMKPPAGFGGFPPMGGNDEPVELKDILKQPDKNKWRYNGPSVMRGDMREAMQLGRNADKMECDCWNEHCPFHGNCRKCIVFHMALKQFPTCQRAMLTELHLQDLFDVELHIERDENGNPKPEPDWNEMWANGVRPGPGGYFPQKKKD